MAKFIYRMQNILDIKYKLEETAKQEYTVARLALTEEEEKLEGLLARKNRYYEKYQEALIGNLDFLTINELSNANSILDNMIENQNEVIKKKSKELEIVKAKLNTVIQERKMHEKLKEKKFEEFLKELNYEENKVTDEVVSYKFRKEEE